MIECGDITPTRRSVIRGGIAKALERVAETVAGDDHRDSMLPHFAGILYLARLLGVRLRLARLEFG